MSSLEFIKQLSAGDAAEAKETLNNLISSVAFESLELKKQEIAKDLFGESKKVDEETELTEESLTSGKKLISKHGDGQHTAKVYRDPEYNEYQVHYYKDGKHMGEGPVSYHDSDKEDAQSTAEHEVKRLNSK